MEKRDLLLVGLAGLLLWAFVQMAQIRRLSQEVEDLQEPVAEVVRQREYIREEISERAVEATAPEAPEPVHEPEPPTFHPLDVDLAHDLQEHAWRLAGEYSIPFEVVMAIAWHESRFQLDAVGYNTNGTWDSGLMQINSANHDWLQRQHDLDAGDPFDNIEAGVVILAGFWEKYTPEQALTAYGWGEAGMLRAGVTSPSAQRVLDKAAEYSTALEVMTE